MIEWILKGALNRLCLIEILSFTARIIFIITEGGSNFVIYVRDLR
jgi:hypothetical protein